MSKQVRRVAKLHWPTVNFYREQCAILQSMVENDETVVVAGNELGKDFIAGFVSLSFFLWPQMFFPPAYVAEVESWRKGRLEYLAHTRRVITTSVRQKHLDVLWGELSRYLTSSVYPMLETRGGPLAVNSLEIRFKEERDVKKPYNYLVGCVSEKGEGLAGHHAAYNLCVIDEASGVDDAVYEFAQGWAKKFFIFGNPNRCNNFFRKMVEGGDIPKEDGSGFYRKLIRIRAEDSPNVRLAQAQLGRGETPTGETLVPGVLSWDAYRRRRATWDKERQCIGLDAMFYEGAEIKLYSSEWLTRAKQLYKLRDPRRRATAIGVDTAEGGDSTAMIAGDRLGVLEAVSKKTPNTDVIPGEVKAFAHKHGVAPENILFDRGGGGKQHADRLCAGGWPVRSVHFSESVTLDLRRGLHPFAARVENRAERTVYKNRRAQMYGELSDMSEFAISPEETELLRQLSLVPKEYDEGRLVIRSKSRRPGTEENNRKTLSELVGHSPDEMDALVLMVHGVLHRMVRCNAGVV